MDSDWAYIVDVWKQYASDRKQVLDALCTSGRGPRKRIIHGCYAYVHHEQRHILYSDVFWIARQRHGLDETDAVRHVKSVLVGGEADEGLLLAVRAVRC